ncbi:hypothetical protein T01_13835 [Trichinella spiralis]|uniref:Uncharacterized protein n=1 Tax=Trichinella spiralis TaxID=6334 RepID=A0A0V1BQX8_TRISP|nr:hypothetical protein T01_13835 [Trichinella spiralis]
METFLPMIEMSVISGTIQKAVIDNVHQVGQEGWEREMAGRRTCEMQYGKITSGFQSYQTVLYTAEAITVMYPSISEVSGTKYQ